jgi:hypothetical protein
MKNNSSTLSYLADLIASIIILEDIQISIEDVSLDDIFSHPDVIANPTISHSIRLAKNIFHNNPSLCVTFHDMLISSYKMFYELKLYEDIFGDDPLDDIIEGEGVERHIAYHIGTRWVDINMQVFDDGLHMYWDESSLDGGTMEFIVVQDITRLMNVLSVTTENQIIEALMERCKSIEAPLDMRLFFQFLQNNQLEYTKKQVGVHDVKCVDGDLVDNFIITDII